MKTLATIDIGTNTTLLLVGRAAPGGGVEVLDERAEITRLGRGIGTGGALGAAGIAATLDVLRAYARIAHEHGATIAAIGTEGLRRARQRRATFLDPAREILGVAVEVIDGDARGGPHLPRGRRVVPRRGGERRRASAGGRRHRRWLDRRSSSPSAASFARAPACRSVRCA